MPLTQQFARVTPTYLERCRASALDSPDAGPDWEPPDSDTLDADWALWGLLRYSRDRLGDVALTALLDRVTSGDPGGDVGFLDHPEVCDGFSDPPRLLSPAAVAHLSRALGGVDLDGALGGLPATVSEAASVCGFGGFTGDVRAYLARHFTATRAFFRVAAQQGMCVVVRTD
ncbi:hypothetical protein SRB17_50840 [Streptomyces sp. RB17]|uniref:DUF1877 domain-containing protein n=1 Tax=Streptomyces sp. RB17 TaxID=2585197 RepID=UPI00129697EC|nr:DUF1877 domain-containing protein [Streptomyces sp. RB17]MQY37081.1 hypothetical protein [Streptomyces sp. RB17]